jgi:hypothetical protein
VRLGEDAVDRRGEHLEAVHGVPADDDRDIHTANLPNQINKNLRLQIILFKS